MIGARQTAQGGGDAYLAKFDSKGNLLSENQFGTSGDDQVRATATGSRRQPLCRQRAERPCHRQQICQWRHHRRRRSGPRIWARWQAGGAIGGLTVSGGKVYVSGTTSNGNLTAGGQASIATACHRRHRRLCLRPHRQWRQRQRRSCLLCRHLGQRPGRRGHGGPDGTVYLTGSTTGTFAGQQRNIQNVTNAFATALNANGSVQWTQQYGGADGQSDRRGPGDRSQGSSVLDALGLPRGTISLNQSVDLTIQTTLRAGDTFKIKIQGIAARTTTITIDKGETINSLATKINAQLGGIGKAAVNYTGGAEGLKHHGQSRQHHRI